MHTSFFLEWSNNFAFKMNKDVSLFFKEQSSN